MRFRALRTLCLVLTSMPILAAEAPARTLKIATIAPSGSSWLVEMQAAAKRIAERTDGRVALKFYPGGVMGNDQTVLRKMRAGQLQGAALPSGALSGILPDVDLYSLPLIFRSHAEVDYVRQRLDPPLVEALEDKGFVALALSENGFAYLMSARPMRRVQDLSQGRVWIPENDVMSGTALAVSGVTPVQLPLADVYTALQTGLVDTVAAPAMGAIAFQWHTKVKYVTDVPLMYLIGVLVIDARAWSRIAPADQALVRELIADAAKRLQQANRVGEDNAREALRQQGIEFVTASSDAEVERWRDITRRALVELRAKQLYSNERIDQMETLLDEYRSSNGGAGDG